MVFHEYTHGLSNRLVNNGLGSALLAKQSRAMGEGWSDFFAMDFLVEKGFEPDTAADGELLHGDYTNSDTLNHGRTRRSTAPSAPQTQRAAPARWAPAPAASPSGTSAGIPLLQHPTANFPFFEEHAEGELWAQTLWDLRKAIGGSATRRLAAEAMRLSPVPPSMIDERDATCSRTPPPAGSSTTRSGRRSPGAEWASAPPPPGRARRASSRPWRRRRRAGGKPVITDPAPLGDGDGALEPGETARVKIPLRNLTPAALAVNNARLSATAPAVVGAPTVDYGSIGSEQTGTPVAAFAVTIPSGATCGAALPVDSRSTKRPDRAHAAGR